MKPLSLTCRLRWHNDGQYSKAAVSVNRRLTVQFISRSACTQGSPLIPDTETLPGLM
jgi:hypothetical protein